MTKIEYYTNYRTGIQWEPVYYNTKTKHLHLLTDPRILIGSAEFLTYGQMSMYVGNPRELTFLVEGEYE